MKVLIACEYSGVVRDEFLKRGHNAWSCDILPTESSRPNGLTSGHLVMDALRVITLAKWDLMIAHPPCTYLTNAGAKHLYIGGRKENGEDPERWRKMRLAAEFYNALLSSGIPRIAIENPVMHRHAAALVGKPSQYVQPYQFGHAETKKTGLRLVNLPKLVPTRNIPPDFEKWPPGKGNGYEPKCHYASPGPNRGKDRARTLIGLAEAFAEQWGALPV